MKTHTLIALPLAAALSLPVMVAVAPATAGTQGREIVVTGSPREAALTTWSNRVRTDLEAKMRAPAPLGANLFTRDRIVEVKFECDDSGEPRDVTLARSSGSHRFDHAALRTVNKLSSLHPMPDGMRSGQTVLAQLMYINSGGSERDIERRIKSLQKEANERNQWFYRNEIASGGMILIAAAK